MRDKEPNGLDAAFRVASRMESEDIAYRAVENVADNRNRGRDDLQARAIYSIDD